MFVEIFSEDLKHIFLSGTHTIRDAISVLHKTGRQIVLVCDENQRLLGTITDGDIRRAILKNIELDCSISQIMNTNPVTVSFKETDEISKNLMYQNDIRQLPVLDSLNRIVSLKIFQHIHQPSITRPVMVIMAGGKGKRLAPYTNEIPKPLVEVNGKPMIQHIIERARESGIKRIYVSVNHFGEKLRKFLGDGSKFSIELECFDEEKPLGTAGALSLLKSQFNEPVIVTNGDIMSKVDYLAMLNKHVVNQHDATMAVRPYTIQNQFGIVETKNSSITGFVEKPKYHSIINAGLYCLSPKVIDLLEVNTYCDMPTLFMRALDNGMSAKVYPLHESWIDVGNPDDLEKARNSNH